MGSNSVTFYIASVLNGDQVLKERICSARSKFFLLRVDPNFERLGQPRKQMRSHKSCFSLEK